MKHRRLLDHKAFRAATRELSRRFKKIRKNGAHLARLDPGARHKLLIQAKKLRYGIGFFSSLFDGKKSARRCIDLTKKLRAFQDKLGRLYHRSRTPD